MKEASSSVWSFQMILIFMLIFSGFLALILVYSKAYTIKNRFISIIEKYSGIDEDTIQILNNFAKNNGYVATSKCPTDEDKTWYGVIISDNVVESVNPDTNYNYCFASGYDNNNMVYYDIQMFYKFSLPILSGLGLYRINGKTSSFRPSREIIM